MSLNKKSFIVTFHATLVAKGVLELEEVSEGNELKSLVEEVLSEIGFGEESNNDGWVTASNSLIEEEIDPIDEEFKVTDSVEDSEVQGIGRATEVEPQEDSEDENSHKGGILPN